MLFHQFIMDFPQASARDATWTEMNFHPERGGHEPFNKRIACIEIFGYGRRGARGKLSLMSPTSGKPMVMTSMGSMGTTIIMSTTKCASGAWKVAGQ